MRDADALAPEIAFARGEIAGGATPEAVIGLLRERGVTKQESMQVLQSTLDTTHVESKLMVHHSPAWADRKRLDEELEETFFRALFIDCVLGNGQINEPPEDVAECRERQERARALMLAIIAALPDGRPLSSATNWRRVASSMPSSAWSRYARASTHRSIDGGS